MREFFKIEKRKSAWERGKEIVNKGKRGRNRKEGESESDREGSNELNE